MIVKTSGDIFKSDAEALVNPVNTVGVSGAGLAREFKIRLPENYASYYTSCASKMLRVGGLHCTENFINGGKKVTIINLPTKKHWRDKSRLCYIADGLDALNAFVASHGIKSVAVPALGADIGGLEWDDVAEIIEKKLAESECVFYIYCPKRTKQEEK